MPCSARQDLPDHPARWNRGLVTSITGRSRPSPRLRKGHTLGRHRVRRGLHLAPSHSRSARDDLAKAWNFKAWNFEIPYRAPAFRVFLGMAGFGVCGLAARAAFGGNLNILLSSRCKRPSADNVAPGRPQMFQRAITAFVAAALAIFAVQAASAQTVLFENARVIPGDGSPAIDDAALLVEGGMITRVARKGDIVSNTLCYVYVAALLLASRRSSSAPQREQLDDNLAAADLALDATQVQKLDELSKPTLNFPADFMGIIPGFAYGGTTINGRSGPISPFVPQKDGVRY